MPDTHAAGGIASLYVPFSIGKLAERCGVATSALRFYEEKGLIQSFRNASGYRMYPRATIRRVAFILFAQRVGLTLEEIAEELALLPDDRLAVKEDWEKLSAGWAARIDTRIAELIRLRDTLTDCIGCGCLSMEKCHLVNPADRAAGLGAGPRYWMGDPRPDPVAPPPDPRGS
ncbi:MAG: redox-sensitive transcriptional activator SoxR [Rhodothermales bacterium]